MKQISIISLIVGVFFPFLAEAQVSSLSLSQSKTDYVVGEVFTLEVIVDTDAQDVNAVGAYLHYPVEFLEVLSVNTSSSLMEFIAEETYGEGEIKISGGTRTPGFNGIHEVAIIEFRAVGAGLANVSFAADSAVVTDRGNVNLFQGGLDAAVQIAQQVPKKPELTSSYARASFPYTVATHFLVASVFSFFDGLFR
jgi:hypothetical protein